MKKLKVRVKTRQQVDEIVGFDREGILIVRVRAPAHEGKANRRLTELLATRLRVPRSQIEIASGAGSAHKILRIPDDAKLP